MDPKKLNHALDTGMSVMRTDALALDYSSRRYGEAVLFMRYQFAMGIGVGGAIEAVTSGKGAIGLIWSLLGVLAMLFWWRRAKPMRAETLKVKAKLDSSIEQTRAHVADLPDPPA